LAGQRAVRPQLLDVVMEWCCLSGYLERQHSLIDGALPYGSDAGAVSALCLLRNRQFATHQPASKAVDRRQFLR
jgi:hypothetical protein